MFFYALNVSRFKDFLVTLHHNCAFSTAKLLKMIERIVIAVLIIAICIALLCVKLIFRKDGEFASMHIHDSQAMKDRNIHCVMDQDREARKRVGVPPRRRPGE